MVEGKGRIMNAKEVFELCTKIKAFYSSFTFPNEKLSEWTGRLSNRRYEDVLASLYIYVDTDESNRPPTLAHLLKHRAKPQEEITAYFDRKRMVIVWKPMQGIVYELPVFWNGTAWEDTIYHYLWGGVEDVS